MIRFYDLKNVELEVYVVIVVIAIVVIVAALIVITVTVALVVTLVIVVTELVVERIRRGNQVQSISAIMTAMTLYRMTAAATMLYRIAFAAVTFYRMAFIVIIVLVRRARKRGAEQHHGEDD